MITCLKCILKLEVKSEISQLLETIGYKQTTRNDLDLTRCAESEQTERRYKHNEHRCMEGMYHLVHLHHENKPI